MEYLQQAFKICIVVYTLYGATSQKFPTWCKKKYMRITLHLIL